MAASGGHWKKGIYSPPGESHVETVRRLIREYKGAGGDMGVEMGRRGRARNMNQQMPTTKRYEELAKSRDKRQAEIKKILARGGYDWLTH